MLYLEHGVWVWSSDKQLNIKWITAYQYLEQGTNAHVHV